MASKAKQQSCVCTRMYGKTGRILFKYVWWYVDMPYHSADLWAHPRTHSWSVELPRARKRAIQGSIAHLMLLLNKILHHLRWFRVPINGLSGLSSRICVCIYIYMYIHMYMSTYVYIYIHSRNIVCIQYVSIGAAFSPSTTVDLFHSFWTSGISPAFDVVPPPSLPPTQRLVLHRYLWGKPPRLGLGKRPCGNSAFCVKISGVTIWKLASWLLFCFSLSCLGAIYVFISPTQKAHMSYSLDWRMAGWCGMPWWNASTPGHLWPIAVASASPRSVHQQDPRSYAVAPIPRDESFGILGHLGTCCDTVCVCVCDVKTKCKSPNQHHIEVRNITSHDFVACFKSFTITYELGSLSFFGI